MKTEPELDTFFFARGSYRIADIDGWAVPGNFCWRQTLLHRDKTMEDPAGAGPSLLLIFLVLLANDGLNRGEW
jgi:hypothetical protein